MCPIGNMNKEELVEQLKKLQRNKDEEPYDTEQLHIIADSLLLKFIDDKHVNRAFNKVPKWYS
jgi:hypothetical protein